jgi:hypothetical protein
MSERFDMFDSFAKSFLQADLFGLFGLLRPYTWLEPSYGANGVNYRVVVAPYQARRAQFDRAFAI